MKQKILEARIEFKANEVVRITVLVEMSKNDVRAIFGTTKASPGYMSISPGITEISEQLLQEVADYGMETIDRDEIFPNWKSNYLKALA